MMLDSSERIFLHKFRKICILKQSLSNQGISMIDPVENPVLAAYIFSNMLRDSEREVLRTGGEKIEKLASVNRKDQTVEIKTYVLGRTTHVPVTEMSMEGFRHAEEFKTGEIRYTPEFWHSNLLTSDEVSEICEWLMRLQSAHVTADSVMEGEQPEDSKETNAFYKTQYFKGLDNCCKLIMHLGALKESVY